MYQKSAVPLKLLFSSAGYTVNKTHSSLEQNASNTLVCLHSWLSGYIWVRKHTCYLLFV